MEEMMKQVYESLGETKFVINGLGRIIDKQNNTIKKLKWTVNKQKKANGLCLLVTGLAIIQGTIINAALNDKVNSLEKEVESIKQTKGE